MGRQMERFGPTLRGGPLFRWLGEHLAVDLANTVMVVREGEEVDLLGSPEDLERWLDAERSRLGAVPDFAKHLDEVRAFRDAVREVLMAAADGRAPRADAVEGVNAASLADPLAPQLEASSGGALRALEHTPARDPATRVLATLARSAIGLVTSRESEWLQVCSAPSCGMFFIGRRRWCCAACGNRARAARHYRRAREPTA